MFDTTLQNKATACYLQEESSLSLAKTKKSFFWLGAQSSSCRRNSKKKNYNFLSYYLTAKKKNIFFFNAAKFKDAMHNLIHLIQKIVRLE